jgi:hypothetical protein
LRVRTVVKRLAVDRSRRRQGADGPLAHMPGGRVSP